MKKLGIVMLAVVMVMFAVGCDNGSGSNGGGNGDPLMTFEPGMDRSTINGVFETELPAELVTDFTVQVWDLDDVITHVSAAVVVLCNPKFPENATRIPQTSSGEFSSAA